MHYFSTLLTSARTCSIVLDGIADSAGMTVFAYAALTDDRRTHAEHGISPTTFCSAAYLLYLD